jgi:hypothetical protein
LLHWFYVLSVGLVTRWFGAADDIPNPAKARGTSGR